MSPNPPTVYARRLRKAHREQICRCKVGSCSICGSKCRRCMCACDGVEPAEALARSRGGYRQLANSLSRDRKEKKQVQVGSSGRIKSSTTQTNTSFRASIDSNKNITNVTKLSKSTTTLRDIKQLSRRSIRSTSTKPSTTSTNNTNVAKDINTSTRSAIGPPQATSIG